MKTLFSFVIYTFLYFRSMTGILPTQRKSQDNQSFSNKGPICLNGPLGIRDSTLTSFRSVYICISTIQSKKIKFNNDRKKLQNFLLITYQLTSSIYLHVIKILYIVLTPHPWDNQSYNFRKPFLGHDYYNLSLLI